MIHHWQIGSNKLLHRLGSRQEFVLVQADEWLTSRLVLYNNSNNTVNTIMILWVSG